jgi:hypothetical protein
MIGGMSLWTAICLIMLVVGLVMQKWPVVAWSIILYGLGWVLRISFGTTDRVN